MPAVQPSDFYTGIVVDVYRPLRSAVPDADVYADFVRTAGEPALELGCGDGDPLLALRQLGLDVEGLDSSPDMLRALRVRARELGLEVTLHHSTMQDMDLGRRYRSIYLAGPTFNLLPDDETAAQALARIQVHLAPDGAALIPLFVPDPVRDEDLGRVREHVDERGRTLRVTATATRRDEQARLQETTLLYEVEEGAETHSVEQPWTLHWWSQDQFRELVDGAGLRVVAVVDPTGAPASADAPAFAFWLGPQD